VARDRKAEAERRDARARAQGFTSYGQQYRGSRQGYQAQGAEYNAAMEVAHGAELTRRTLGGRQVIAGRAETPAQRRALIKAILRAAG